MGEMQEGLPTDLAGHVGHGPWQTSGGCVYCPCGLRLYQGTAPKDQDAFTAALAAVIEHVTTERPDR